MVSGSAYFFLSLFFSRREMRRIEEDKSLFRSFFLGFSRKKRRLCMFTKSSMSLIFLIQFLGFLRISVFALFRVFSGLHLYPYNIVCLCNWSIAPLITFDKQRIGMFNTRISLFITTFLKAYL